MNTSGTCYDPSIIELRPLIVDGHYGPHHRYCTHLGSEASLTYPAASHPHTRGASRWN
ncbi:hypothetical protein AVEN_14295-1, partial [Araneus ventricosus]